MSEELQEIIDSNPEWYKDLQYIDVKKFIQDNINSAARSFVAIGYYLKYIRDNELHIEDGYTDIWVFAKGEFGIGKSSASSFMGINDKFSKDGNSPILLEKYKDFSSSKLSEMLTLTDEQLEQITITTIRAEIREMKQPEKVESVPEETVLHAEQKIESQLSRCLHQAGTECNIVNAKEVIADDPDVNCNGKCCWECKESCGARCNSSAHRPDEINLRHDENPTDIIEEADVLLPCDDCGHDKIGCCNYPDTEDDYCVMGDKQIPRDDPENDVDLITDEEDGTCEFGDKWIPKTKDNSEPEKVETVEADIIQTEPKPIYSAKHHLNDAIKHEEDTLAMMRENWKAKQPDTLLKHETILLAYKSLLVDMEYPVSEPVKPEQPELPVLRNNDQRKDFIDAYATWPIWIDTELTGERYYRYNFDNGESFVIRVSQVHKFFGWSNGGYSKTETEYGKEEYFLCGGTGSDEWGPKVKTFHESSNNKSAMIEYLKDIQKK